MHHPTDRIAHTMAFVTPVVEHWLEREIAQWVHPMKDRSNDPSHHERTLYLWATSRSSSYRNATLLAQSVQTLDFVLFFVWSKSQNSFSWMKPLLISISSWWWMFSNYPSMLSYGLVSKIINKTVDSKSYILKGDVFVLHQFHTCLHMFLTHFVNSDTM